MYIVCLFIGAIFIGIGLAFYQNSYTNSALVSMVLGVCFFITSSFLSLYSGYNEGIVRGLVDSGKYEIVSNKDYSLNELKTFIKIQGVYLKETDNE